MIHTLYIERTHTHTFIIVSKKIGDESRESTSTERIVEDAS